MIRDSHFLIQKTNPQSKRFGVRESFAELCGTVGVWISASLQTFFVQLQKNKTCAKETKQMQSSWSFKRERSGICGRSWLSQSP